MTGDDTSAKQAWEPPATVALTETDSRADQCDVAQRNLGPALS